MHTPKRLGAVSQNRIAHTVISTQWQNNGAILGNVVIHESVSPWPTPYTPPLLCFINTIFK